MYTFLYSCRDAYYTKCLRRRNIYLLNKVTFEIFRNHHFDTRQKIRQAGRWKYDRVSSDRKAIYHGFLGVRWERSRCYMTKILPCRRMGISDDNNLIISSNIRALFIICSFIFIFCCLSCFHFPKMRVSI